MAIERERKFLVEGDEWRGAAHRSARLRQGYLQSSPRSSVRVRIGGDRAWLNVKGATVGAARLEFEYEIPLADAGEMLDALCAPPLVEKTRYFVRHRDREWEVDEFEGANAGLVVAEVEFESEGATLEIPPWAGREVTDDPRYYNASLATRPFRTWDPDPGG